MNIRNLIINGFPNSGILRTIFSNGRMGIDHGDGGITPKKPHLISNEGNGNAIFTFVPGEQIPVGHPVTGIPTSRGRNTSKFSAPLTVSWSDRRLRDRSGR